jgi:predicted TIM-barrel fold metal-dependent hydrolase
MILEGRDMPMRKKEHEEELMVRRTFFKGAMATGAVGVAATIGSRIVNADSGVFAQTSSVAGTGKKIKKIALEEHVFPKGFLEALQKVGGHLPANPAAAKKVVEYGEKRIQEMDECGIDVQVLSLSYPALEFFTNAADATEVSKMVNDELAETVHRYPTRFSAFCCIPLQDPDAAANELERSVTKLGFRAVMINDNTPSRWLADQKYEVVFEKMAELNLPMYIHTDGPSSDDSGLHIVPHIMRIVDSELLVKYPNLQFILGHAGESLPFWLNRLDGRWRTHPDRPIKFSGYFKKNFYVTTSSQCWPILLQFLIAALGSDRIMFATDYPYESSKDAVDFIDSAPISASDHEKICHLNAETLLRL